MRGVEKESPSTPNSREASPLRRHPREPNELPGLRSGYDTPSSSDWVTIPRQVFFSTDASVVLIGVRGVGKSSLGILAASAYNRRLVDTERAFHDATGLTSQAYRKVHGTEEYHKKHHRILEQTLQAYDKDSIIVCGFADLENHGSILLRTFAQTHPVIHIVRDAKGIQSYLQVWSLERTKQLLRASGPLLRSCTNFEFFNLSEKLIESTNQGVQDLAKSSSGLFLTLKRVERDFLKFLRNILGDHERMPFYHEAYPLSKVPITQRSFTCAAVIDVDDVLDGRADLDGLQIGADAVELRLPLHESAGAEESHENHLFRLSEAFATIRRSSILPLILSVAWAGHPRTSYKFLSTMISHSFRLSAEYCTVDLSLEDSQLAPLIAGKGCTQVIGIAKTYERPSHGWDDIAPLATYERADRLGCDIVKITMPALQLRDNFDVNAFRLRVESLRRNPHLIAYNTGTLGRTSMCFNKILTPVTAAKPSGQPKSDGDTLITAKDVAKSLFASFIYEPMHFFIYGANVSFSLSPAMHNSAYSACGMPHKFGTHSSPNLEDFKRLSKDHHFGGAAVVQPYKTGVMPLLDGLSSHAKAIGSVNTIIPVRELDPNGGIPDEVQMLSQCNRSGPVKALYGHNTDWIGIRACLRQGLSPANTVREHSTALVCGAGGQARSTIYSMISLGVRNIFVCNRTKKNAEILAHHYNKLIQSNSISELDPSNAASTQVRVIDSFTEPWPKDFRHPSLIVSSIPTQTADGTPVDFTIPDDWLRSPTGGVLIELAYRPMVTPIVRQMREQSHKGWIFMDGFDILPEQAYAQFELFTGRRAPRKLMKDEVIKRYREEQKQQGHDLLNKDPNPPAR